jgi:hypothetical protein
MGRENINNSTTVGHYNHETNAGGMLFTGSSKPGEREDYETNAGGMLYTGPGKIHVDRRGLFSNS